jgi:hypothetical protein
MGLAPAIAFAWLLPRFLAGPDDVEGSEAPEEGRRRSGIAGITNPLASLTFAGASVSPYAIKGSMNNGVSNS